MYDIRDFEWTTGSGSFRPLFRFSTSKNQRTSWCQVGRLPRSVECTYKNKKMSVWFPRKCGKRKENLVYSFTTGGFVKNPVDKMQAKTWNLFLFCV